MSCLRLIGRLVALFIVFIFVTVTPPFVLAFNAQQVAVSGDFLDKLFEDSDLFEAAIPEIAADLAREIRDNSETRHLPIARLEADGWEHIINAVAPPEFMQRWAQQDVEGWRTWVRTGRGRFLDDIIIPFGEIRANIVNDPDLTVLRTLTEAQPECTAGQEPFAGPTDLVPQCRPQAAGLETFYQRLALRWREQPRQVWQQLLPDDLDRYPDNISLADFIEEQSGREWDVRFRWRASRWGLRAARWLLALFIAGQCVVALGLVALLAARNWREALRWVGTPLVLAGVFTLLLALLLFVGAEIGTWFIPAEEVPIGVQEVMEDAGRAFANDLWPPTAWHAGILVLIGLGLWVLSFFTPIAPQLAPAPPTRAPVKPAQSADTKPAEEAVPELVEETEAGAPSHAQPDQGPQDGPGQETSA